jgi:NADP-dependent 3-hydroxy acid dehydrogenase YdfG
MSDNKVWFVTGCSTGFGRCLTEELLKSHHQVVATARNISSLDDLVKKYPQQIFAVKLDVTNIDDIKAGVAAALERFGRIDVLVNNAGYGMIGALEESDEKEIKRIFDTNVFGLMNMTKAVLPLMRKQKSGRILNLSSVAGFVSTPGFGIYRAHEMPEYNESMKSTRQYIKDADGNQAGDPVRGAKAMMELVELENPPVRIPFGKIAVDRIKVKISNFQKDLSLYEKMILETDFPK